MSLIKRLEAEIRRQDRKVADAMSRDFYNQPAADLRDLLEEVRVLLTKQILVPDDFNFSGDARRPAVGYVAFDV